SYHSANKSWETTLLTGTFQNPNLMVVGGRDSMADHTETLEFASKSLSVWSVLCSLSSWFRWLARSPV
ncbi:hypothetical protein MTO96_040158, partial [Rhipicephalus appendiculatus]